jgi:CDP-6-deoxy-D-xylo-4-hexulose-3-dehydrase
MTRTKLLNRLNELGIESRPIVAGNFAKNEVVKHFEAEVHGTLENADHIDQNGLFIGNQHYPIREAIAALRSI